MVTKSTLGVLSVLIVMIVAVSAFAQNATTPDILPLAGRQLYALKKCGDCHNPGATKYTALPAKVDSTKLADHLTALKSEIVLRVESNPRRQKRVFGEEVAALAAYSGTTASARKAIDDAPKNLLTGAYVMYRESCRNCHLINGIGKDTGPNLKGVSSRHKREWLIDHFKDPQKYVADSVMPKFDKLPADELAAMTDYLETLK
jgi:mono/diheme cytochrome c family protein